MATALSISADQKNELLNFLKKNRNADLVSTYLFFVEEKYHLKPLESKDLKLFDVKLELTGSTVSKYIPPLGNVLIILL